VASRRRSLASSSLSAPDQSPIAPATAARRALRRHRSALKPCTVGAKHGLIVPLVPGVKNVLR